MQEAVAVQEQTSPALASGRHQVVDDEEEQPGLCDSSDDEDNGSEEMQKMRASAIREAILEHYSGWRLSQVHHWALMMAGGWPRNTIMMPQGESPASRHPIEISVQYSKGTQAQRLRPRISMTEIDVGLTSVRALCPRHS